MNWYNLDVAEAWQLGFQDPASPIMEEIVNFHHYVMVYLTFILFAVAYILVETLRTYNKSNKYIAHKYLIHGTWLEIMWTITPFNFNSRPNWWSCLISVVGPNELWKKTKKKKKHIK